MAYNVIPSDELKHYQEAPYPLALIVNSKDSSHPGEHWLGLYSKDGAVTFFCSYGLGLDFYGKDFEEFGKDKYIIQNKTSLQSPDSNVCGKYALYFISMMLRGCNLNTVYCGFSDNVRKNDEIVSRFVNRHKLNVCRVSKKCKIQTSINYCFKN